MPQAQITINGFPVSNDDLPINVVVALNNNNIGGELTYNWSILDQPPGAADALSSAVIQNPTFTPKKEGTYLLKLVVNLALPSEVSDIKIVGIRQLKTRERVPAAGETTEDGTRGWADPGGAFLQLVDKTAADPGVLTAVVETGAPNVNIANVVRASSTEVLKSGLPGQENVVGVRTTTAAVFANIDQMLALCIGAVDGSAGPYVPGTLIRVRVFGLRTGLTGVPVVGDPVYVSDAGTIALVPGTNTRQIGNVTRASFGTYDVFIDGTYGATVGLTGAAPVNVTKAAASAGVGVTAARHDHKHDITTAAPVSIGTDTSNAEGAAVSLARSDHTHEVNVAQFSANQTAAVTVTIGAPQQVGTVGTFELAVPAGTYLIEFGAEFSNSGVNNDSVFNIRTGANFGASVAITAANRNIRSAALGTGTLVHISIIAVLAATTIFVGGNTVGGTTTINDRTLMAIRLA